MKHCLPDTAATAAVRLPWQGALNLPQLDGGITHGTPAHPVEPLTHNSCVGRCVIFFSGIVAEGQDRKSSSEGQEQEITSKGGRVNIIAICYMYVYMCVCVQYILHIYN